MRAQDGLKSAGVGGMVNKAVKSKAEVMVLGSSRAIHHFDSEVVSEVLGKSVYNAGRDGTGLDYSLIMAELIFQQSNPKLIILEVGPVEMLERNYEEQRVRLASMAPYLDRSSKARELLYDSSCWQRLKYLSRAYPFNSQLLYFVFDPLKEDEAGSGFVPLTKKATASSLDKGSQRYIKGISWQVSESAFDSLKQIIQLVKSHHADIVLVTTPRWFPNKMAPEPYDRVAHMIEEVAEDQGVPYLELTSDTVPVLTDPALYADAGHLNGKGAKIFSTFVDNKILHSMDQSNRWAHHEGDGRNAATSGRTGPFHSHESGRCSSSAAKQSYVNGNTYSTKSVGTNAAIISATADTAAPTRDSH